MIHPSHTRPHWLPAHTLAIGFSVSHLILDRHLDLFGPLIPTSLSVVQAFVLVMGAVVYASWAAALVLASQGSQWGLMTTLVLCAVGGFGNGLSIVACPPPCSGASPFGDIGHIGSLIFNMWAMVETWQALKHR